MDTLAKARGKISQVQVILNETRRAKQAAEDALQAKEKSLRDAKAEIFTLQGKL